MKDAGKTKYTVHVLALGKHKEKCPNADIQFLFNVTFHFHFVDFKYIYPLRYFFLYLKCSFSEYPYCTLNSHIWKKKKQRKKTCS